MYRNYVTQPEITKTDIDGTATQKKNRPRTEGHCEGLQIERNHLLILFDALDLILIIIKRPDQATCVYLIPLPGR